MGSEDQSMGEKETAGYDFKMLPIPAPAEQQVGGPRSVVQTNLLLVRSSRVRVEVDGNEGGDFKTPPPVYQAIVEYQRGAYWWPNRDDLVWLRNWGQTFIKEFGIKVRDASYLPLPLIKIESMNVKTIGTYRAGPDGYALGGTIVLNEERLRDLPEYMKLALLLKLLFCAWEHQRCHDDIFVNDCRERMKEAGLSITEEGIAIERDSRFQKLLEHWHIEIPETPVLFPKPKRQGKSTNQLWSCTCQRVRVGTQEFLAVCPECNQVFQPGDHVGKKFLDPPGDQARARIAQVLKCLRHALASARGCCSSSTSAPSRT